MYERVEHFPASIVAGFCGRNGGVSSGRLHSLNFGTNNQDTPQALAENLRRLAASAGFEADKLVSVPQVHGIDIVHGANASLQTPADGLWLHHTDERARVVAVRTGDCVPILLCDRAGTYVMALHSGWRGTVANIAAAGVELLRERGVLATDILAAIGPCIEQAAFEVGDEVAQHFAAQFQTRNEHTGKAHVDLPGAVRSQLIAQGVPASSIVRLGGCTHRHPERYFSYRRDGQGSGLQYSFIGWPANAKK